MSTLSAASRPLTSSQQETDLIVPPSSSLTSLAEAVESSADVTTRGIYSLLEHEVSKQTNSGLETAPSTQVSTTSMSSRNASRKRSHQQEFTRLDLSNVKERIVEGITMMEIGQLASATSLFERAGTDLMVHFMQHVQSKPVQETDQEIESSDTLPTTRPTKRARLSSSSSKVSLPKSAESSTPPNNNTPQFKPIFFAPFFRPDTPSGSPFMQASFNYPFTFVALEEDSTEKQNIYSPTGTSYDTLADASIIHKLQHQEMAAYTATVIFNLGLCNHLRSPPTEHHLQTAVQHYRRAWSSANESSPPNRQSTMLIIQMATSLNLSDCLYRLGRLDECHAWIDNLKRIVLPCARKHSCISESLVEFFEKAAKTRTRCIAAGAA